MKEKNLTANGENEIKIFRSTLDDKIFVQPDLWTVALCRKPKGKNPEHAFLIVEGINSFGAVVFKRYDLFKEKNNSSQGLVYIKPTVKIRIDANLQDTLCNEILSNEEIHCLVWSITKEQAKTLHKNIQEDIKNPPSYSSSGEDSIFVQASHASEEGWHNCFTWAREKLLEIDDDEKCFEKTLPKTWESLIVSRTSKHIKATSARDSSRCIFM